MNTIKTNNEYKLNVQIIRVFIKIERMALFEGTVPSIYLKMGASTIENDISTIERN